MVYPENIDWHGEVEVIFQTIENLRASIKGDCGDWYFTGDYPTPGGYSMVNLAYIRWYRGRRRPQLRPAALPLGFRPARLTPHRRTRGIRARKLRRIAQIPDQRPAAHHHGEHEKHKEQAETGFHGRRQFGPARPQHPIPNFLKAAEIALSLSKKSLFARRFKCFDFPDRQGGYSAP
jgi:hypothetical protein